MTEAGVSRHSFHSGISEIILKLRKTGFCCDVSSGNNATILHMSRQLSYRNICGIVARSVRHFTQEQHGENLKLIYNRCLKCSLTVFPSQFKFDGNFVSLSPRFKYSARYKILYMTRQLCCRVMCKKWLRSDGQQRNHSKAKFPSSLNCEQKKNVSETGPWMQCIMG